MHKARTILSVGVFTLNFIIMTPIEFDAIFKKHWWLILDLAKSYLVKYDVFYAQEAVSHAFIKLWESGLNLNSDEAKAWLLVTVKRKCLDIIKTNNNKKTTPLSQDDEADTHLDYIDMYSIHLSEIANEVMQEVIKILKAYTAREKLIFNLHFIQSLTAPEIAKILKTKPQTVHTQLTTLRKKLRADIKKPLP